MGALVSHMNVAQVQMRVLSGLSLLLVHCWFSSLHKNQQEIFMRLAALLFEYFLPIRANGARCQDIDQVLLRGDQFFSVHACSSSEVLGTDH